jgi:hypothetical protein
MEVSEAAEAQACWRAVYRHAGRVLKRWCSDDLLDRLDTVASHGPGDKGVEVRRTLEEAYLTPAQQRYAGRAYPETHKRPPGTWPTPIEADRVSTETREELATIIRSHQVDSGPAWAATRLLCVAAVIEVVRSGLEEVRG